ncbi:MAG: MATE family efflux transporter [Kiritimatiellae bacterium]|nr:MATE family efflux transporter [Kiritimatiellia bacterium]
MLAGTFAMTAYNLTDTWFVSRLGTLPLAAMGFTFPVVMLLTFVSRGIGTGVTALVSHAIGRHAHDEAARVVTHGIVLIMAVSLVMSVAGYLSIDFLFARSGADALTRPLVGEYMRTWYIGAVFMSLPVLGNGILISTGDSRGASLFMILGTILNAILDPIMIFGYFGVPAMGIRGAALATVIAQGVSTAWLILLLRRKHRLLVFRREGVGAYVVTAGRILRLGIPSVLSMILMPVSASVIMRLLSHFGSAAVAAAGAAGRIEMFAFVVPMALGISLTPFVSQNYGAGRMARIREAFGIGTRFALVYGAGIACLFFLGARWLAGLFSADPEVVASLVAYIRIISFGYGMMEVHRYCGFVLTGLHRPIQSALLNAIRIIVLLIPLSCVGAYLYGVRGVFLGRLVTDITVGFIGLAWVSRSTAGESARAE